MARVLVVRIKNTNTMTTKSIVFFVGQLPTVHVPTVRTKNTSTVAEHTNASFAVQPQSDPAQTVLTASTKNNSSANLKGDEMAIHEVGADIPIQVLGKTDIVFQ